VDRYIIPIWAHLLSIKLLSGAVKPTKRRYNMEPERNRTGPVRIESFHITAKSGRFEVEAQINIMGRDLQVNLLGGVGHIGAVGMGEPRSSLKNPMKISSTSSVFTFVSHKEDAIVKPMAEALAKALNRKVVVTAGIHWDGLTQEEISEISSVCEEIIGKIVGKMTSP
jgi:gallate decarboxylase subunit D